MTPVAEIAQSLGADYMASGLGEDGLGLTLGTRPRMNLPIAAERTDMMTRLANAPEKTVTRLCFDARIAAMRNVLSPTSQHRQLGYRGPMRVH